MRIGITGHQERNGISWSWVSDAILAQFAEVPTGSEALSSLARGADQVFARCAIERGLQLVAVIPFDNYASLFDSEAKLEFENLLAKSKAVELHLKLEPEEAFLRAGHYVVDHSDHLIAVWDGQPAAGRGGTADIVDYALERRRAVIHINPIAQTVTNR